MEVLRVTAQDPVALLACWGCLYEKISNHYCSQSMSQNSELDCMLEAGTGCWHRTTQAQSLAPLLTLCELGPVIQLPIYLQPPIYEAGVIMIAAISWHIVRTDLVETLIASITRWLMQLLPLNLLSKYKIWRKDSVPPTFCL